MEDEARDMIQLYILIACMLIGALCLIALPFFLNKKQQRASLFKGYFIVALLFIVLAVELYHSLHNQTALKQWLTRGRQHYDLLVKFNDLGGLEGVVTKVQKRVQSMPNDAQGWFILGKLYFIQKDYTKAKAALKKAHALLPHDDNITQYYEMVQKH
jgi:cytochrome c-type biogenesis protein CcmH/NrfG